jgi:CheY-like chemotaxis protein
MGGPGGDANVKLAVVNNDTDFLTLMTEVLKERGWQTVVCRESHGAYNTIKDAQPDAVILDVRMESPESGWNILELIRLDPATRDIPVLVCSAAAIELREKEEWLKSHGVATLLKPFDIEDLYEAVEKILPE